MDQEKYKKDALINLKHHYHLIRVTIFALMTIL